MKRVARIYHNPRCSKSRAALALLHQHGITTEIVDYLATPPSAETLRRLVELLAIAPSALLRKEEPEYRALGLAEVGDETQVLEIMSQHPRLIQRPIVVIGDRAVLGRPPENVQRLLDDIDLRPEPA